MPDPSGGPRTNWLIPALFSLASFLNAALLFWIQPLIAKMLLPSLGGTPAVWIACMLFFQAALLAGYLYAFAVSRMRDFRIQLSIHAALLLCAALFLPRALSGTLVGQSARPDLPTPWLVAALAASIGLPFLAASTHGPLLQRWLSLTRHRGAGDPYFLFAAGNLGSLTALLGFPVVLEPSLALGSQSRLWGVLFAGMLALVALCASITWRSAGRSSGASGDPPGPEQRESLSARRRATWTLLAFVPSSLMLGVTLHISTDIAAVPLLWVIPLAMYLLTLVLAFSRRRLLPHRRVVSLFPGAALLLVFVYLSGAAEPVWFLVPLHLVFFFLASMLCHGRLADDRPSPGNLVEYYIWIAVGGMLGGVVNALLAPAVFDRILEYPLGMALACFMLYDPARRETDPRRHGLDLGLGLAVLALTAVLALVVPGSGLPRIEELSVALGVPVFAAYMLRRRPLSFGLAVAGIMIGSTLYSANTGRLLHVERGFFGVLRVDEDPSGSLRRLYHGNTVHGKQFTDAGRRCEPLAYYHREGPLGEIFEAFHPSRAGARVGIIGLGVGSMGAFATPGQEWTFFEIDPAVTAIARNRAYFSFLQDCVPAPVEVTTGDARLRLGEFPDAHFDLLALDAFSSDAIPVHLLTLEAMKLYLSKLAPRGVLAFHISNRTLQLDAVLAGLAGRFGLTGYAFNDTERLPEQGKDPSRWAVVARGSDDLGQLPRLRHWVPLSVHPRPVLWTDDFSNILRVMK